MFKHSLATEMDLSDAVRRKRSAKRILNAKVSNANWAVRQYVRNLKREGRTTFDAAQAKGVFRQYGVNPHLLDYAVRQLSESVAAIN
jgi:hypothetical protein